MHFNRKWKWVEKLLQIVVSGLLRERYILNVHDNEGVRLAQNKTKNDGH